jgi:Holliday junction DNA helicase RuvA
LLRAEKRERDGANKKIVILGLVPRIQGLETGSSQWASRLLQPSIVTALGPRNKSEDDSGVYHAMIAKLRGRLDSSGEDWAVVDVNGVGYLLFCATRTLAALPGMGEVVELAVETHVREDHIHLYGFTSTAEREMFRTLMTVQGVGAKVALSILSALSAEQVAQAIAAGDQAAFKRASGVGAKLAARLVIELKDKVPAFAGAMRVVATKGKVAAPGNAVEEAVSALVNLGYSRMDAFGAVSRIAAGGNPPLNVLIRDSLRELGAANG